MLGMNSNANNDLEWLPSAVWVSLDKVLRALNILGSSDAQFTDQDAEVTCARCCLISFVNNRVSSSCHPAWAKKE